MPFEPATFVGIAVYLIVLLVPGLAVLALAGLRPVDPLVHLGLAFGAGLATQPLLYLWASAAGLAVGAGTWLLLLVLAVGTLAWRWRAVSRSTIAGTRRFGPAHWALLGLVACALAARWWAVRDLTVPLWGDSFQHSLQVKMFLLDRGLPHDWRPFADLASYSYHFGLHAGVATLAWLTGLPVHRALLIAGQLLMVLQLFTAFALAAGLTGRPWVGVGAALAAAGLSPMPAYFVNWGRYTQLAGQVLLPAAALAAVWAAAGLRRSERKELRRPAAWRGVVLAGWLVAGLALTHYLVTVFFTAFAAAWVLVGTVPEPRIGQDADRDRAVESAGAATARTTSFHIVGWLRGCLARVGGLLPVAVVSFGLVLPWVPRVLGGHLDEMAGQLMTTRVATDAYGIAGPALVWGGWAAVDRHLGLPLLAALVLATVWGLARRQSAAVLGLLWAGLMLLAAYPGAVGLPVSGLVKDFTVVIGLYLPAGLVVGAALGELVAVERARWPRTEGVAVAGIVLLGAVLAWRQRDVVDAAYLLATSADERAAAWIRANTPADAVFLVSSFDAFGDSVQAGDDGGWWLPVLADRRTTVPPITVGIERGADPGYRERVNELARVCREDLDGPACRTGLDAAGVAYAYVGPTGKALPRDRLAHSANWRAVFTDGEARVYERLR